MLFSIDDKQMTGIPRRRQEQWMTWRGNLPEPDYENIVSQINEFCDNTPHFISSFMPKQIWGDELHQPLLNACNQSKDNAGFFVGLIIWQTIIQRGDEWIFKPADDDDDILGTTYWRR